jgi:hypothetical protein
MEKCLIYLLLVNDSTTHTLGKVNDIMIKLHKTFEPVDFVIMDMGSKASSR